MAFAFRIQTKTKKNVFALSFTKYLKIYNKTVIKKVYSNAQFT